MAATILESLNNAFPATEALVKELGLWRYNITTNCKVDEPAEIHVTLHIGKDSTRIDRQAFTLNADNGVWRRR